MQTTGNDSHDFLSKTTYQWLNHYANYNETPDQVAGSMLREQLLPHHAYLETIKRLRGRQAMIKGTQINIIDVIAIYKLAECLECSLMKLLQLSLAQAYVMLSYYYAYQEEIDAMLAEDVYNKPQVILNNI